MKNRNGIITKKILSEISDIEDFINNMDEYSFIEDKKTQKAVVMSIINIGELSKSYTEDFILKHKDIPWRQIRAMRNLAAHNYEIVKPEIVWDTVQISLPELKAKLK